MLGAVASAAVGYAVGGRLAKEMGGAQVICWALILAMPAIVGPARVMMPSALDSIPPVIWAGFLYLALVSQLLGFFLWNAGLAIGGIARVSQTQLAQPFVTIAASAMLLGEAIDPGTLLFAFLVIGVVAVGSGMPVAAKNKVGRSAPGYCRSNEN